MNLQHQKRIGSRTARRIPLFVLFACLILGGCNGSLKTLPGMGVEDPPLRANGLLAAPESAPSESAVAGGLHFVQLEMVTDSTGWALAFSGAPDAPLDRRRQLLLRTENGGLSWHDVAPPDSDRTPWAAVYGDASPLDVLDAEHAWLLDSRGNGITTVWRTEDGGRSWSRTVIKTGYDTTVLPYSVDFLDARHGWVLVGPEYGMIKQGGRLFRTRDGGRTWERVSAFNPGDPLAPGRVTFINETLGFLTCNGASTGPMHLYRSSDSGRTWHLVRLPIPPGIDSPETFTQIGSPVRVADQKLLLVAASVQDPHGHAATLIYASADRGITWTIRGEPLIGWPTWAREDPRVGWEVPGTWEAPVVMSQDGGRTWLREADTDLLRILGGEKYALDLAAVDAVSARDAWAVRRNDDSTDDLLLRTRDGGVHWERIVPQVESPE